MPGRADQNTIYPKEPYGILRNPKDYSTMLKYLCKKIGNTEFSGFSEYKILVPY